MSTHMAGIPLWRYFLSYFFEQRIEQTGSAHNPRLLVSLRNGQLQLSADQAIYSYGDLYVNFRYAFSQLNFEQLPERADVLLLGFGLGSIPQMLETRYHKCYHYTAVEIDEVIIELASEYILPDLKASIQLIRADARDFIGHCKDRYHLICMDIFQDAKIPADFETPAFLQALHQLLHPRGILLFNRLADTPSHRKNSQAFFDKTFRSVFPEAVSLDSGGNLILVNRPEALKNGKKTTV